MDEIDPELIACIDTGLLAQGEFAWARKAHEMINIPPSIQEGAPTLQEVGFRPGRHEQVRKFFMSAWTRSQAS